jgi:hypothetical protein
MLMDQSPFTNAVHVPKRHNHEVFGLVYHHGRGFVEVTRTISASFPLQYPDFDFR